MWTSSQCYIFDKSTQVVWYWHLKTQKSWYPWRYEAGDWQDFLKMKEKKNHYWPMLTVSLSQWRVFMKLPEPESRASISLCRHLFAFLGSPLPSKHPGSPGSGMPQRWGKPISREGTYCLQDPPQLSYISWFSYYRHRTRQWLVGKH